MAIIPSDQQIRTLSGGVDLTNRGNALTQAQNAVYTMSDIVETVNAGGGEDYKVLTGFWQYDQDDIGQDEPVLTILSNTTGETVTPSRLVNGFYQFTLSGTGVEGDGYLSSTQVISSGSDSRLIASSVIESGGNVTRLDFFAYTASNTSVGSDTNGEKIYFELRVY